MSSISKIKNGKLGASKLAKKLPQETLEKIRNQELNTKEILHALVTEAFSTNVLEVCVGAVEREVAAYFRNEGGKDLVSVNQKEFEIKLDALAFYAIPGCGHHFDKLRLEFVKAFCRGFSDKGFSDLEETGPSESMKWPPDECMQAGFNRACDELMTKIIRKCYNGKTKKYREHCTMHNAPMEVFKPFLSAMFMKALETHPFKEVHDSLPELYKIAKMLQRDESRLSQSCWECKALESLDFCASCLGARYCGRACQTKAWNNGHKYSCPSIKKIRENHLNNLRIIKAALADPEGHERRYGFKPNNRIDYLLAWCPFQVFPATTGSGDKWRIELPSMEYFYSNLSEVKNGMLWSDFPGSIPKLESAATLSFDDGTDLDHILRNGVALSYEYPENGDSPAEVFKYRETQLYLNRSSGAIFTDECLPDKSIHNSNCSAAEFLKSYIEWEAPLSYSTIFKDNANIQAYRHMQAFDVNIGSEKLEKKCLGKDVKKKRPVKMELLETHEKRTNERLRRRKEELEREIQWLTVQLELLEKKKEKENK